MNKFLSMVAILALSSVGAVAAGTAVNTSITNTATLNFNVGGVTQTEVTSNEDSFVVDKKIDFVLTHEDATKHLIVVANKEDAPREFKLVNESNAPQKYSIAVSDLTGNEVYDAKADSAVMQNLEFSIDGGAWTSGPLATAELAADASVTILVRGDVLASATDGEVMNVQLEATAVKDNGTTAEVSTATADDKAAVDTVLGEGATVTDFGNAEFDGKYSAWAGYLVNTPNVDLTKLSCVFSDAVTTTAANSKRIPGATVVYVFDLNNTSTSTDASGITLADTLNDAYDLTGTVASAKAQTGVTTACTCTNGDAEGGNGGTALGGDAVVAGQDVTLSNLSVTKNSHTCVSIQAKIK